MMIIRMITALVIFTGMLSIGTVYAAEKKGDKQAASKKRTAITHPCARKSVAQLNKRAAPFRENIQLYSKKYQVDADLIKSVITIESCFNQKAVSHKGAQGLMQLIPATAERFGLSNAFDTKQNLKGGTQYLSWLSNRFDGDLEKVLAGYNAGEGRVDRYNGIPPFRETQHYVRNVLAVYNKFKQHEKSLLAKKSEGADSKQPAPQAKQQKLTPQQVRQRQQQQARARQLALQRQKLQKLRQQRQTDRNNHIVIGQPSKPYYVTVPAGKPQQPQQQDSGIIIGGVSRPVAVQQTVARKSKPVVKQARATPSQNKQPAASKPATPQRARVSQVYASPFKPGRAGWQANKALAPQLYKQ